MRDVRIVSRDAKLPVIAVDCLRVPAEPSPELVPGTHIADIVRKGAMSSHVPRRPRGTWEYLVSLRSFSGWIPSSEANQTRRVRVESPRLLTTAWQRQGPLLRCGSQFASEATAGQDEEEPVTFGVNDRNQTRLDIFRHSTRVDWQSTNPRHSLIVLRRF